MKEKFLRQFTEFIFVNDQPQEADVIFIPGNGWPQMAERAAELYREGYAPRLLPSGRHSITKGTFPECGPGPMSTAAITARSGNLSGMC